MNLRKDFVFLNQFEHITG